MWVIGINNNCLNSAAYSGPKVQNITIDNSKPYVTFKCPGSDDSTARYCRIHDIAGDVFDGCEKSFVYTPSYNKWTCQVLRWGDMLETETVINFLEDGKIILLSLYYRTIIQFKYIFKNQLSL